MRANQGLCTQIGECRIVSYLLAFSRCKKLLHYPSAWQQVCAIVDRLLSHVTSLPWLSLPNSSKELRRIKFRK